jgi:hypothetical protein
VVVARLPSGPGPNSGESFGPQVHMATTAEPEPSREFTGGLAMPMRDRLLGAVAAASPCSKGKMPLQLPPPPPGMPASQVEKWRKEVAKIVNKQVYFRDILQLPLARDAAQGHSAS